MIKRDNFYFKRSTRKNKKYDVYDVNKKYITSFGDNRYQQYRDVIGLYKEKNHNDKERRRLYYLRHGNADRHGNAKWFSHKYLWPLI